MKKHKTPWTRHGYSRHPIYKLWNDMKRRCYNEKRDNYPRYGGRGITVCNRWLDSFPNFLADMSERPEGTSLDRIDNNGNYEPSNCKWKTCAEQTRNSSSAKLTEQSVRDIKRLSMQGVKDVVLSKLNNVAVSTIRDIRVGNTWRDIE